MSGTSADGIDVAIIETDGIEVFGLGPCLTVPYPAALRRRIMATYGAARAPAAVVEELTRSHAAAIELLAKKNNLSDLNINIIGFHGQTILHRPQDRLTVQLGDGALLARLTGCAVVNRFREADVAAGGEGAPLVPLYHAALARRAVRSGRLELPVAIVNIGGVANVTYVGAAGAPDLIAFDTGPGNALIDDWTRATTGRAMDRGGRLAAAGTVDRRALDLLLAHSYFRRAPPKSLDRDAFSLAPLAGLSAADGAATLSAFTVQAIAGAARHFPAPPRRWLVAGGGVANPTLMRGLAEAAGEVAPVEALGWRSDALEAEAFAYLAVRSLRGLPLSLPSTTGVPRPTTGGVIHSPPRAGSSRSPRPRSRRRRLPVRRAGPRKNG
jgi:anhydro-N-acetylmuramic acid kinase